MNKQQIKTIIAWRETILVFIENITPDVATFIACQFALESNYGTSKLTTEHNNFSGMKKALVRPTLSHKIKGSEFAHYNEPIDCILDYFLCLAFHRIEYRELSSVKAFSFAIKNWYCPEKSYIDKITSIYNQFKSQSHEQN